MLVDSHCHLYFEAFDEDRPEVLARMMDAGVQGAVIIGIDAATNELAQHTAALAPGLHYSVGLHPTSEFPSSVAELQRFNAADYLAPWLKAETPPVAIGECGVDLHWDTNSLKEQRVVFKAQLELGRELGLPVVVHTRKADEETRQVLEAVPGARGVLHCFNGSLALLEFAQTANARGDAWYISFAGNLTYKRAEELRQAAQAVPLDRLLAETDSPFLAPQPKRGRRNEPAFVTHVVEELAHLRGLSLEAMQEQLLGNSQACFGVSWA